MSNEKSSAAIDKDVFVTVTLNAFKANVEKADKFFSSLTEDELQKEVGPGRNRLVYLWGHLTAMHDRVIQLLGLGERLHPEFDALFLATPDKAAELPSVSEIRAAWNAVNAQLLAGAAGLSASGWLEKHSAVSAEDFAKDPLRNRFSVLLTRGNHLSHHLGQAALTSK
jgi:hypothetical protein